MRLTKFFSPGLYRRITCQSRKDRGVIWDCSIRASERVLAPLKAVLVVLVVLVPGTLVAVEHSPHARDFPITVNPTALVPPTSWHVPGVTPLIYTMDPTTFEAFSTAAVKELRLKPGQYRFGTFTFDFPFIVSRKGLLQFASSLDQCVKGRGTQSLTVLCSHTQPYPQQPDY